jgi:diadenosine tetraphosphate (Ap4A) HIT family hydrolase
MSDIEATCFTCESTANESELGPSNSIWSSEGWRVAHSFNSSLLGWLVVVPRRHVESLHELTEGEATELGALLRTASTALVDVLGCLKTYVVMFAEAPGFNHVHFHVIPRASDLDPDLRGSSIFHFLKQPESSWVPLAERNHLALQLRAAALP